MELSMASIPEIRMPQYSWILVLYLSGGTTFWDLVNRWKSDSYLVNKRLSKHVCRFFLQVEGWQWPTYSVFLGKDKERAETEPQSPTHRPKFSFQWMCAYWAVPVGWAACYTLGASRDEGGGPAVTHKGTVHRAGPPGQCTGTGGKGEHLKKEGWLWGTRSEAEREGGWRKAEGFQVGVEAKGQEWVAGKEAEERAKIARVRLFFSVSQHSYLELLTQHFYQRNICIWGALEERASAFIPSPLTLQGRR